MCHDAAVAKRIIPAMNGCVSIDGCTHVYVSGLEL